jgi:predicted HicB family RNase H-like nuclease
MRRYTERMSFTVPSELKRDMKMKAAAMGISLSEYVRRSIDDILDREELIEKLNR